MSDRKTENLTDVAQALLAPKNPAHRQYEALRAYFVDGLPSKEAARRFGYSPGGFRVLCCEFRKNPNRNFFEPEQRKVEPSAAKQALREKIVALRKRNLSVYDIEAELKHAGPRPLSAPAIAAILKEEGFARLPRRRDEERPQRPRPEKAAAADARALDLEPRRFRTQFGGLFLFVPYLVDIGFERIVQQAGLPGTKQLPAAHAMRSLLALKLYCNGRHSHVMSHVMDEGLALFAGLNAIPKRSFLTEYSCRISASCYPKLMRLWFDGLGRLGLSRGSSFDLDFHTIPFHGEDALVEKHYVSKRSRRQKGILGFLARDAEKNLLCYANADIRKDRQNDEILRFVEFWRKRTGTFPEELIFDSKLTTYANLDRLNKKGINFITLRRRGPRIIEEIKALPASAWRRIQLEGVGRAYRTPRIFEKKVQLSGCEAPIRQIFVADLGHEEPTVLLTNQMNRSARKLISRYAQRMVIENAIADGIDFFHMDALSSAVAMKVNCDLQLTLMAYSLYRLLGMEVGNAHETAKSRRLYRDFVNAAAQVTIDSREIQVRFQKRSHNPLLTEAGFREKSVRVPWLNNRTLTLAFG